MQATPFKTKGITKFVFNDLGKISVGDKMVNTKTKNNKHFSTIVLADKVYQMATPVVAIIKVGDSALWLKITTQINKDAI